MRFKVEEVVVDTEGWIGVILEIESHSRIKVKLNVDDTIKYYEFDELSPIFKQGDSYDK